MRKLTVVSVIVLFLFAGKSVFAENSGTKAHPASPFNIINGWFDFSGKKADGTWLWEFEKKKSTLTAEELEERRNRVGMGMRGKPGDGD